MSTKKCICGERESVLCSLDLALLLIPEKFDSDFQRLERASDPRRELLFVRWLCDLREGRVFVEAEVHELGRVALADGGRSV